MSLQTGYLIKSNGANSCILYYLTQVDPRGKCHVQAQLGKSRAQESSADTGHQVWAHLNYLPSLELGCAPWSSQVGQHKQPWP